ncbi:hypothetical protein BGM24_25285 [Bacillus sp. FJAT-26377]|nr:hypothetical protein [Bacillus sp. FJAT-26377]
MGAVATEEIGNKILNWSRYIKTRDLSASKRIKKEIDKELKKTNSNQDLINYYTLLNSRYYLMINDIQKANQSINSIDSIINKLGGPEEAEAYYKYFFQGLYKGYQGENNEALIFFKLAEEQLNKVKNPIEIAEFRFKLGSLFYNKKSTLLSVYYIQQARDTFASLNSESDDFLYQRVMFCDTTLALNLIDQGEYDKAEQSLTYVLKRARDNNDQLLKAMTLYNVGFLKTKRKEYRAAVQYILEALDIKEFKESQPINYLCAVYELCRIYYKNRVLQEANQYHQKGLETAMKLEHRPFQCKFRILFALYVNRDHKVVEKNMMDLYDNGDYVDLEELSLDVAKFYSDNNDYRRSVHYYEMHIQCLNKLKINT